MRYPHEFDVTEPQQSRWGMMLVVKGIRAWDGVAAVGLVDFHLACPARKRACPHACPEPTGLSPSLTRHSIRIELRSPPCMPLGAGNVPQKSTVAAFDTARPQLVPHTPRPAPTQPRASPAPSASPPARATCLSYSCWYSTAPTRGP